MCTYFEDYRHLLLAEQEQQVEMILDLTRRIHLLEALMSAADQERRLDAEGMFLTAVQISGVDELKFQ